MLVEDGPVVNGVILHQNSAQAKRRPPSAPDRIDVRLLLDSGCGGGRADKELNLVDSRWLDQLSIMGIVPYTVPEMLVSSILGGEDRSFNTAVDVYLDIPGARSTAAVIKFYVDYDVDTNYSTDYFTIGLRTMTLRQLDVVEIAGRQNAAKLSPTPEFVATACSKVCSLDPFAVQDDDDSQIAVASRPSTSSAPVSPWLELVVPRLNLATNPTPTYAALDRHDSVR